MSRWYAVLGALLVVGAVVAFLFGAWPLGLVLLVIGGASLAAEIRANRKPGYVPMEGRNSTGNDALKAEVLSVRQMRDGQSWIGGGGPTG